MKILKVCLTSVFLSAAGFPVLAEQLVVVGIEGKAPVGLGDVLDAAGPIVLEDGATLTLINANGKKLQVSGPHNGPLGDQKASSSTVSATSANQNTGYDVVKSLAGLFKPNDDAKSLGAFRAGLSRVPGPWVYNVASGADYCLDAGQQPKLWRESARKKTIVTLSNENGEKSKPLVWKKGKSTLTWPSAIQVENSMTYQTRVGRKAKVQPVTVHLVPGNLPTRAHKAAWMIGQGCEEQARRLIVTADVDRTIHEPE